MKEYDPENSADGLTFFSNQTGVTLVSIAHSIAEGTDTRMRHEPPGLRLSHHQQACHFRNNVFHFPG
ncbi:MAG: hypothetical protein WAM79_10270 [Candidatus Sulfotelmatobacter sp.]